MPQLTITATVTDADGNTGTGSASVTVGGGGPVMPPDLGAPSEPVQLPQASTMTVEHRTSLREAT